MNYDFKSILKHTSIYSVGSLASKGIGFLLIPLYTNYLSPKDYGILELLTISVTLASIIIQGGISAAVFKFSNTYEKEAERREIFSTVLIFLTLVCLSFIIIISLFADRISFLFINKEGYGYYLILMLVSFFFSTVASVPETFLMAQKKSKLFTAISIGTLIVNLSLNIYMIAIARQGVLGILYASIISRFLNTTFLLVVTIPKIGLRLNIAKLRRVLGFAYPLVPAELALFVFSFSDRLFLSHMSDLKSVGLYSLGYKFAFMISLLLVQPFMRIWQQEMYDVKKKSDAPDIFGRIYTYLIGAVLIAGGLMSIFIKDVIAIIAAPEFLEAWRIVPIIALAYVFRSTYLYFQMGMFFKNKTAYISYATVAGAISILLFNYFLVPRYGGMGSALSVLFSYIILSVISLSVSQRLYRVHIEYRRLIKLFLVVGTVGVIYVFLINIDTRILSIAFRFTSIPAMLLGIYLTGFFRKSEIGKIRQLVSLRSRKLA